MIQQILKGAITANCAAVRTAHAAYLHSVQNRRSLRRLVKCLCAYRERQEKAENKARAAAETIWRNLLRSIFTRIKVQGDYADDADNGSGEPNCSYSVPSQNTWLRSDVAVGPTFLCQAPSFLV